MKVVVPAGSNLIDAARWVGGSCWLELAAFQRLSRQMATVGLDDAVRVALWSVRSHRDEMASAWHRRLPELREMPRSDFVLAPTDGDRWLEGEDAPDSVIDTVTAMLAALDGRYAAHQLVAVGPADGPVAATLARARQLLAEDVDALGAFSA